MFPAYLRKSNWICCYLRKISFQLQTFADGIVSFFVILSQSFLTIKTPALILSAWFCSNKTEAARAVAPATYNQVLYFSNEMPYRY
jgi:hypothetical protein